MSDTAVEVEALRKLLLSVSNDRDSLRARIQEAEARAEQFEGGEDFARGLAKEMQAERDDALARAEEVKAYAEEANAGWRAALRERDEARAQIGAPPAGSHPDEAGPRDETWHKERANWSTEVANLRAVLGVVTRERDAALEALKVARGLLGELLAQASQAWMDERMTPEPIRKARSFLAALSTKGDAK